MDSLKYRNLIAVFNRTTEDIIGILKENLAGHPDRKRLIIRILTVLITMGSFLIILNSAGNLQELVVSVSPPKKNFFVPVDIEQGKYIKQLEMENKRMERRLSTLIPTGNYLVINTSENSFKLYSYGSLRLEGFCSTGSYILLEADSTQQWIFKTPQGAFRIQGKIKYPVWRKPDWAFIEEGVPVPPPHVPERYEYGVLGDYALSLGRGYFIHGTLYERLLGMPVTHGCIRMNDNDLKTVYNALQEGSRVFIF